VTKEKKQAVTPASFFKDTNSLPVTPTHDAYLENGT